MPSLEDTAIKPDERIVETPRGNFGIRAVGTPAHPLVLCLHGFPDCASTFDSLLKDLAAQGFHAMAPTCRGYAPSPLQNAGGGAFGRDLFSVLARDCLAIVDGIAPGCRFDVVGHDIGGFTVYHLLRIAPERVRRAVTMSAGHPAAVFSNIRRMPGQIWRSRYAFLFRVPGLSEWYVRQNAFAYVESLWRRWAAPGWEAPKEHLAEVKRTLAASMPWPLLHYRAGAFSRRGRWPPIRTPTLHLAGALDGCLLPEAVAGQERYFSGPFRSELIQNAGHFLHLEQPKIVNGEIVRWLAAT